MYSANNPVNAVDLDGRDYELNNAEKELLNQYPIIERLSIMNQLRINQNKTEEMLVKLFDRPADGDNSNAFKHAYFTSLNALTIGSDFAKKFGDAHEYLDTEQKRNQEKTNIEMDLNNNLIGLMIAEDFSGYNQKNATKMLAKEILKQISNGKLVKRIDFRGEKMNSIIPTNNVGFGKLGNAWLEK